MPFGDVVIGGGFGAVGQSRVALPLEQLATQAGIEPPKPKFGFSNLIDLLNLPSKKTEELFTGGKGYEASGASPAGAFLLRLGLDPLNLVAPLKLGKLALKGVGVAAKTATKIKPIARVAKGAEELFVPYAKLKRVSPQLAEELPAFETATRAREIQATRKVGKLGKQWSPEIRKNIGKLVEKAGAGGKLTSQEAKAVEEATEFIKTQITTPEKIAKLAPKEIANYFPRKADREAVENLLKFGGGKLSLKLGGAEKVRTYATQVAGEEAGIVYKDALQALAIRASKSEAARANSDFLRRLVTGEVKDLDGNPLFKPMTKKTQLLLGHTLVRIDKSGLRIGDKFLGFYPAKTEVGKKIIGVTTRAANFQVPTEAAEAVAKYYNTFTSDEAINGLLKFYDGALGVWKGSVTSLFPAFHLRNVLGNLANMFLGGFTNPTHLATAAKIQKGKLISVKGTEITKDLLEQLGLTGKGQFGYDIPDILGDIIGKERTLAKLNPIELGRKLGSVFEENARIAFFIDRLSKGDNIPQAVAQVRKYLFDYSYLTQFEKTYMKRLIPFYTWMRNNIPLQLEALISQPQKQAFIAKSFKNLNPLTEEQKEVLPPYLTEGLIAGLGETEEGELRVLSSLGLPFEDLARLYRGSVGRTVEREVLGSMGPLSNLLGLAMNRDLYRGRNIEDLGYTYGRAAQNYPEILKQWLDYREETTKGGDTVYYVDPKKFAILNLVAPRLLRTFGEPISAISFPRVTDVNLEEEKERTQRRKEQELEKKLEEKGVVKRFEKVYIPKGGKGFGGVK